MKFLSQLFEARDTDLTSRAFGRARLKLIAIYLLIIAAVILLFSSLVVTLVNQREALHKLPPQSEILLNTQQARELARHQKRDFEVTGSKYELEDNKLFYEVTFNDGESILVDVVSGNLDKRQGPDKADGLYYLLTNDTYEAIGWIGLLIFFLAGTGSILIANASLDPIAVSAQKQKRFVSDAAHELRNPLAALQTTLESYIRSTTKSKELNETIAQELLAEVKRLIVTSEALLAFENTEARGNQATDCDVMKHVVLVERRLTSRLQEKNLTLTKNISNDILHINQTGLESILYNLVHNAIKFSTPKKEIIVSWNGTELSVSDEGCGIDSKHLPYIFERFYKADMARSLDGEPSNGLGLALVKDIVIASKGKISVQSEVGKGTQFTINFK